MREGLCQAWDAGQCKNAEGEWSRVRPLPLKDRSVRGAQENSAVRQVERGVAVYGLGESS